MLYFYIQVLLVMICSIEYLEWSSYSSYLNLDFKKSYCVYNLVCTTVQFNAVRNKIFDSMTESLVIDVQNMYTSFQGLRCIAAVYSQG